METSHLLPRFPLGQVVATQGVLTTIPQFEIVRALDRHARGDWGDLDPEDAKKNEIALEKGYRPLLSTYTSSTGVQFWILTESDRSATTLLLPEEY
jgi:hypothetical protein